MAEPKNVTIPRAELEEMLERAAAEGARKALAAVGLHDEDAAEDVRDLRSLLEAWREAKATAMRTAIGFTIKVLLVALAAGLGLKIVLKD